MLFVPFVAKFLRMSPATTSRIPAAVAGGWAAIDDTVDDRGRAAHARVDRDRAEAAVLHASTALHAEILISDIRTLVLHFEYALRTNLDAPAAADAFFSIV